VFLERIQHCSLKTTVPDLKTSRVNFEKNDSSFFKNVFGRISKKKKEENMWSVAITNRGGHVFAGDSFVSDNNNKDSLHFLGLSSS